MQRFLRVFSLVALVALGAAGCDDETTPTAPTNPPATVTESFTGTIARNGAAVFSFSVGATGQVTATMVTLTGPADVAVGLSLGNWNGTTCQVVLANDNAKQGTLVTGTMSAAGTLCLRVYDAAGTLESPATFTVDVVHP